MRILLILLILTGCNIQQTEKAKSSELNLLLGQLPSLQTPLTFNSNKEIDLDIVSDSLVKKIETMIPGFIAHGKVFETPDYIAIIIVVPADITTPVLMTYDKVGHKIDSLFMYPTAGGDIGYYSTNIMTVTDDKELILLDSTLTRQINTDGADEIPGTDSLSVATRKFKITDKGKIEEIR